MAKRASAFCPGTAGSHSTHGAAPASLRGSYLQASWLERSAAGDLTARFSELRQVAPSPSGLLAQANPMEALASIGLSQHGARALLAAADAIVELFHGEVPDDDLELRAIPGVGDSLAKTVICFGHNRVAVPLHSAAERVATRVAGHREARRWQMRLDLHQLAGPSGPNAEFNAAVFALGGTVCRDVDPLCGACPISAHCVTGRRNQSGGRVGCG